MPEKLVRKFYYEVKQTEGKFSSTRKVAGRNISEVLEKSMILYHRNWNRYPESIQIKRGNDYTFSQ